MQLVNCKTMSHFLRKYEMKDLIIMLDFISAPIWKDIYYTKKKELVTGIDVVDNDECVQK